MARPIRVLIADDNARARQGLRVLFATRPEIAIVGEATNGQEALRLVEECRPDVVLLDIHIPVLDGVQTMEIIKRQWPELVVVVLTIYAGEQAAALAAGADTFITKGSSPERLFAALGAAMSLSP